MLSTFFANAEIIQVFADTADAVPHILASEPSALKMRMNASASGSGSIKISPSAPTENRDGLKSPTRFQDPWDGLSVKTVKIYIIVSGAMHFAKQYFINSYS